MQNTIKFKGRQDGIHLLAEQQNFAEVLTELGRTLAEAPDFFTEGTVIWVPSEFSGAQYEEVQAVLTGHGLQCRQQSQQEAAPPKPISKRVPDELVVPGTVRGGQRIQHPGDIIIGGDVNPGAEVVAGGNIFIKGTCRGLAHAGYPNNDKATITARRLWASQLRIAHVIARSPDTFESADYAEVARIQKDSIIIEPGSLGEEKSRWDK